MTYCTFSVKTFSDSKTLVKYSFVGEEISNDESSIYHECHSSSSEINALRGDGDKAELLKSDGDTVECLIDEKIEWEAQFEVQIYAMSMNNLDENYIIVSGWLNQNICIGEATSARIDISGTPVDLNISYEDQNGWTIDECSGQYQYTKLYDNKSSVSKKFAPNSEFFRIGFDNYKPDSIDLTYRE